LEQVAASAITADVKTSIAVADVGNIEQVNTAIAKIKNESGEIDILVNNAGTGVFGKFLELEPAQWEIIIRVNLLGVYYVTRAVLPGMIERKSGDIVNVSSTSGQKGSAVTNAYSASKFGVMGLT
jgi:3-oxoacyl-[acyl-carrier protein] reductase